MTSHDKLKYTFIFGAVVDMTVALNWILIAMGYDFSSVISGYKGIGKDYQFAMYVCAMFMLGWSLILAWGALKPYARKGLLIITACMLLLSVIVELLVYIESLSGSTMVFGVTKRLFLVALFSYMYFSSTRTG